MSVRYWISSATAAAVTAAFDALETTLATGVGKIERVHLWQLTDLGDAQEEVLRVEFVRGNTTSGSGGQTTVLVPTNSFDSAATMAGEVMNTTVASAGTPVSLAPQGWNIRIPLDYPIPPPQEIAIRTTSRIVLRVSAPADSITANASWLIHQE